MLRITKIKESKVFGRVVNGSMDGKEIVSSSVDNYYIWPESPDEPQGYRFVGEEEILEYKHTEK